jgi:hypothetical protein
MEKETESELSLKEREGDKRETEAGLETPKGRDLGLKEERARDEAEAAMGRRRDKAFRGFWVKKMILRVEIRCSVFGIYGANE